MKRISVFVVFYMLTVSALYAQAKAETGAKAWTFDGQLGLNAAATGLVNWSSGGNNNVNGLTFAKLHLLYKKDVIAWETHFDTDFGLTWIDQADDQIQKNSDNIKLATKFGWEFHKNWYLTVLASFQSQYALGREYKSEEYDPVISKWLSPSYTDISIGLDWKKSVKGCDFSVYLSPVAGRITTAYVSEAWNKKYTEEYKEAMTAAGKPLPDDYFDFRTDMQIKYGTYKFIKLDNKEPALELRNYRCEFGLSFKGAIDYKYEKLTLRSSLAFFTPYQGKGYPLKEAFEQEIQKEDPTYVYEGYYQYSNLNRHFGRFDIDWDVNVSYQLLKMLNVTLGTHLKYYNGTLIERDGIRKERIQFKSVLGLGLGYSF